MRRADAHKLGRTLAGRGEVAYCVLPPDPASHPGSSLDRRTDAREPTRLRSAKLLDGAFRFVCECRIRDRSRNGLQITLARAIRLPARFAVHIDETAEIRCARVVWRRGRFAGVLLLERATGVKPCDRFALRERYYGILD